MEFVYPLRHNIRKQYFFGMLMGSGGMFLVSLNPRDFIGAIGTIQILVVIGGGSLWPMIRVIWRLFQPQV